MVNTTSRLVHLWRTLVALPAQADVAYSSTASLNAQFWLGQFPWRPTAAWSVLAALLAGGSFSQLDGQAWQTVALIVLLVDPLWGSLWRLAAGRKELLPLDAQALTYRFWLPYLQGRSPAEKLLRWNSADITPLLFRVGLPSLLLSLAIALTLGWDAVLLTLLVALISSLGWTSRRSLAIQPVLLQSIVTIALPWWLTTQQFAPTVTGVWLSPSLILAGLATIHHWGECRLLRNSADWLGMAILALAEINIIILLIVMEAPLWLGLLAVLWLPAWLTVYQRQPVQRVNFWWLAALLVAALGLRTYP